MSTSQNGAAAEVIRVAAPVSPALSARRPTPVHELTPRAIDGLVDQAVQESLKAQIDAYGWLVATEGRIKALPETQYAKHYDVQLEADGSTVLLEVPKRLLADPKIIAGDYVRVVGSLRANLHRASFKVRLDVTQIEHTNSPEEVLRQQAETGSLELVRKLRRVRRAFPVDLKPAISVICGRTNQVMGDFMGALGPAAKWVDAKTVFVAMNDPQQIADRIADAPGQIIVVIRGGGEGLGVFNDEKVLLALGAKNAYRIVGIGHSPDTGLADLVADHSADTPTAAGAFVREQLEQLHGAVQGAHVQAEQERALRMKTDQDMNRVLDIARKRESAANAMQGKVREIQIEQNVRAKASRGVLVAVALCAFAIGVMVAGFTAKLL